MEGQYSTYYYFQGTDGEGRKMRAHGTSALVGCSILTIFTLSVCVCVCDGGSSATSEKQVDSIWWHMPWKGWSADWEWTDTICCHMLNFVIMDFLRPPPATMKSNFRFSGVAFRWSQDKLHLQIFCLNISPNVASLLLLLHNMFYQNSYLCSLSIFFSSLEFSFLTSLFTDSLAKKIPDVQLSQKGCFKISCSIFTLPQDGSYIFSLFHSYCCYS